MQILGTRTTQTSQSLSSSKVLLQTLSQGYVFWQDSSTRRTFQSVQVGNLWLYRRWSCLSTKRLIFSKVLPGFPLHRARFHDFNIQTGPNRSKPSLQDLSIRERLLPGLTSRSVASVSLGAVIGYAQRKRGDLSKVSLGAGKLLPKHGWIWLASLGF